jgi:protoporphyrinogen oxidase
MKVLVIGAGFAGCCTALLLRDSFGADVSLIEQAPVPGGMLRTLETKEGLPYEYGPRVVSVFRGTPDVLPFLRRYLDLQERTIYQGTRLRPDYPVIPFPVDLESLRQLPCGEAIERELAAIRAGGAAPRERHLREYLETSVGPTLTELAFEGFNRKFWGRRLEDMPADWGKLRRLERIATVGQYRLPSEASHYYPAGGFNPLFDQMLAAFEVHYGVTVQRIEAQGRPMVVTDRGTFSADLVVTRRPSTRCSGTGMARSNGGDTGSRSTSSKPRSKRRSASRPTASRSRGFTRRGPKPRCAASRTSASSIMARGGRTGPVRPSSCARSSTIASACTRSAGRTKSSTATWTTRLGSRR